MFVLMASFEWYTHVMPSTLALGLASPVIAYSASHNIDRIFNFIIYLIACINFLYYYVWLIHADCDGVLN